jgi:preprotein translocase subunit SecB
MADDAQDGSGAGGDGRAASPEWPSFGIIAQYVKDLSFENPGGPMATSGSDTAPEGDVAIEVKTHRIDDESIEVSLEFEISAQRDGAVAFIIELKYAGVFRVRGLEGEVLNHAVMVECPRLLFPFARRVVFDVVRDGGFPPLMLAPIDFGAIYRQRQESASQPAPADG